MSAIVAWYNHGWACIVADTARTHYERPMQVADSFGQLQDFPSVTVEEGAIKVIELPLGTLAGLTGNVEEGLAFLRDLKSMLAAPGASVHTAVHMAAATHKSRLENAQFALCLAMSDARRSGVAILATGAAVHQASADNGLVVLGSMRPEQAAFIRRAVNEIRKTVPAPKQAVGAVLTVLQAWSLREKTHEQGIGGAFVGAWSGRGAYHWLSDHTYELAALEELATLPVLPVDAPFQAETGAQSIRVRLKDGSLILSSTVNRQLLYKMITPANDHRSLDDWKTFSAKLQPAEWAPVSPADSLSFISASGTAAVYFSGDPRHAGGPVHYREEGDKMLISIRPYLRKALLDPAADGAFRLTMFVQHEQSYQERSLLLK